MAGPDIAAQLIHDDDAQQLGCAVEALVAEEQGLDEEESFRPTRRQRIGEPDGASRSVPPSADEDLIDYITSGANPRPSSDGHPGFTSSFSFASLGSESSASSARALLTVHLPVRRLAPAELY